MRVLVTGSSGLIGSETVRYYDVLGHEVHGIDNNMREVFFGPLGDTRGVRDQLLADTDYTHHHINIFERRVLLELFRDHGPFDLIIHCAAQPSHDKALQNPVFDFEMNAVCTMYMLEAMRRHCPEACFIFMSTNKVYGSNVNQLSLVELPTRYEFDDCKGITEELSVDQCTHSMYGSGKLAADVMVQEYARSFGLCTGVFRGGCLTGSQQSGVPLHGFLNYLVRATLDDIPYVVNGYGGKQVRDNIHAKDVVTALAAFAEKPRSGEVYNIGGCYQNSVSIIEAIARIEELTGKKLIRTYQETNRIGDHIVYYTDMSKFKRDYPEWEMQWSLSDIFEEIVGCLKRARS